MERRVALVTGGTRGIGLGCAEALAREGWDLAVCGVRPPADAEPALEALRGVGAEVLYVQADVGDDDAPARLVDAVAARFGRLDLLVNNAGVAPKERQDLLEASPESFDRVLRINLRGPYFLTQAAARFMLETGTGLGGRRKVHRLHHLDLRRRSPPSTAASTASPRPGSAWPACCGPRAWPTRASRSSRSGPGSSGPT